MNCLITGASSFEKIIELSKYVRHIYIVARHKNLEST